jgi:hypothetical protein
MNNLDCFKARVTWKDGRNPSDCFVDPYSEAIYLLNDRGEPGRLKLEPGAVHKILRYTGLLDSNGVPIFERDIVKYAFVRQLPVSSGEIRIDYRVSVLWPSGHEVYLNPFCSDLVTVIPPKRKK